MDVQRLSTACVRGGKLMDPVTVNAVRIGTQLRLHSPTGFRARCEKRVMPDTVRQEHQTRARYERRKQLRIRTDWNDPIISSGDNRNRCYKTAKAARSQRTPQGWSDREHRPNSRITV
jgi:hypothetical protein